MENIAVIGEEKKTPKTDKQFINKMAKEIYNKMYCIMENQANCCFVNSLCATGDIRRVLTMDRGGSVHSKGFNMKTNLKLFLKALLGLTFAPDKYIGYDTSIELDEQGNTSRVAVGTWTYKINSVVWRTPMI